VKTRLTEPIQWLGGWVGVGILSLGYYTVLPGNDTPVPHFFWSRRWAPPDIGCVRRPSLVRLCLRPPAVEFTQLSCVWPAGGGCAPPVISKKKLCIIVVLCCLLCWPLKRPLHWWMQGCPKPSPPTSTASAAGFSPSCALFVHLNASESRPKCYELSVELCCPTCTKLTGLPWP
jgi:hypothetical protein